MPDGDNGSGVEIRFYHLQRQRLEEALPKLLSKVHDLGLKAIIKVPNETLMKSLDKALWDFDPESFIPHDRDGSKTADLQPVFLTLEDGNPNAASILVLINAVSRGEITGFDRCLYVFDGRDESIVASARADWKKFKELGTEMSYWQQMETGGWEKKA